MIEFFVPGTVRPTQTGSIVRPAGGKRAFPTRRNTDYVAYVRLVASQHRPSRPLAGPIQFEEWVYVARPKKPKPGGEKYPIARPDFDNLIKGLADAFTGVIWVDDSQVVAGRINKRYADFPIEGEQPRPVGVFFHVSVMN